MIREDVRDADGYFSKYMDGDATARDAFDTFDTTIAKLRKHLSIDAPYTAAARAMVFG